ncbi:right-handed parallel beta-helix repeat-containing protein [bacterium]|nr:right-handed parallel beta-helix repeat-containing protein [bacterium]
MYTFDGHGHYMTGVGFDDDVSDDKKYLVYDSQRSRDTVYEIGYFGDDPDYQENHSDDWEGRWKDQIFYISAPIIGIGGLSLFEAITGSSVEEGCVMVRWQALGEDDNCEGYNIYRGNHHYGEYTKVNGSPIWPQHDDNHIYQYLDAGISHNGTYYYVLADVDTYSGETYYINKHGASGDPEDQVFAVPYLEGRAEIPDLNLPAPTNLVATDYPDDDGTRVQLNWTPLDGHVENYQILRRYDDCGFFGYEEIAIMSGSSDSFVDDSVTEDIEYEYIIRQAHYDFPTQQSWGHLDSEPATVIPDDNLHENGRITENATWSGSVLVNGDVVVDTGVTLTIEEGTIVTFFSSDKHNLGIDEERIELIVYGELHVGGTSEPTYLRSSFSPGTQWHGIRLMASAGSSFENVTISQAETALYSYYGPVEVTDCDLSGSGYASVVVDSGSCSITDCDLSGNGGSEGYGVVVNNGTVTLNDCRITDNATDGLLVNGGAATIRNCQITNNTNDGLRLTDGSVNLGTLDEFGWNVFSDNGGKDINSLVTVSARGNEFGTIDGLELDRRVSDSVVLSPVVFGGSVNRGSDLPYVEPDEENLPVCYVDRDVYLVDDFTAEPVVVSFGPSGEVLEYFELRFAPDVRVGLAPEQETPVITPDDPLLVDVLIDVPCYFEKPDGSVPSYSLEPSGGFVPSPWEINESIPPVEFNWGELTFGEHCYELNWTNALIDGATSVKMNSGSFSEANPANFERVFIRNIDAAGFELIKGAASFRSCQISDNLGNGLQLNSGTWAKLYRCEVSGNDGDGIYLNTGVEIDLGVPVGGDEPMVGLNYFADNTGFDLNNSSGSPVAAHGNQWSESDWELILENSIHNPGGVDYHHLFPIAWSGVLKSGENPNKCVWMGNMLLLGDVTVPTGMMVGQQFRLVFELPTGAEGIEIAELPGLDRTHGGEDPNKSEFRINGLVNSEAQIHLTRLSLPTTMFGEFPPPVVGEWTGLIHSSADMDTLDNYEVHWAETGIHVIGGGLTTLSNCRVTRANTAVVLEGVSPTLFGNDFEAEIEGLVCSDNAWPLLVEEPTMNSFYMDFEPATLPPHYYIANRNAALTPFDPTTIDATLCKWHDSNGESQQPEDWMFDGEVDYDSQAMLADNRSQIITEEDDKAELNNHKDTIELASGEETEDTSAIEIGNRDDSVGVSDDTVDDDSIAVGEDVVRLNTDESVTLTDDTLETASLGVEALNTTDSTEEPSQLLSVVPNPTTGMVTITVELEGSQRVALALYDLAGRLVETIHRGSLSEDRHSLSYDTSSIAGGLYLLHLATDKATDTIRLAIVR